MEGQTEGGTIANGCTVAHGTQGCVGNGEDIGSCGQGTEAVAIESRCVLPTVGIGSGSAGNHCFEPPVAELTRSIRGMEGQAKSGVISDQGAIGKGATQRIRYRQGVGSADQGGNRICVQSGVVVPAVGIGRGSPAGRYLQRAIVVATIGILNQCPGKIRSHLHQNAIG